MHIPINVQEHILIWSRASLTIVDVRHIVLPAGKRALTVRLPANAFLYVTQGKANVTLDDAEHAADRYYLLHGGKGARLDIRAGEAPFHYYLIYYKAALSSQAGQRPLREQESALPFQLQYGFAPLHPALLYELAERMLAEWRVEGRLERLHVRTLFHQFAYELLRQMEQQEVRAARPDLPAQLIRYMEEHYAEPLTRETLAHTFHYSVSYLSRQFRRATGASLIDYLTGIRVDRAATLLRQTELSLQQIAASVGYADVSYFIRLFRRHIGVTPKRYQAESRSAAPGSYRPILKLRSSLAARSMRRYIDISDDNHYQYSDRGELPMSRSKLPVGIAMLLCLTLWLSACSGLANTNGGTGAGTTPASNAVSENSASSGHANAGTTTGVSERVPYIGVNGEVLVPKNPQRVVMVAGAFTGHMLALGLKPVGAGDESFNNYTEGMLGGVINLGNDVSYERILELQPDLIVTWNDPALIEQLSKIAPTVAVEYGVPLREQLTDFGKMTGREEQAKDWIAQWDAKIAELKPIVQQAVGDRTVSIFDSGSPKEFYAYGSFGRGGDIIYGEFGLKAPPIIQQEAIDSGKGWAKLSLELLPEYAGDYIFISGWTGEESSPPVFEGAIWDSLPAVQQHRVFREDSRGFVFSDPISLEAQLDFVVDSLTKAE
ncbi:hypothetical protein PA598K_02170 [Paenibacillus sp. 598K]|uniref:AraC family transcriptional regulator n=1 Tax=Paenibacillus sp. 598K TaxID=1117987 RepID=UPI000FFAF564|nr:AraC family transcriptional regulator [Paenibacillus sp. 598K]GBF73847.1 hypothetical protein PA598K_02170 [Paenibacillus sp. 598K]